MFHDHSPQIPAAIQENDNILKLSNDYFEVRHDKNAGGCPVSIIFKNGSGSNFLERPASAHVALKKENRICFFRQCGGSAESFSFTICDDGVKVFTEGKFTDENGSMIPVRYRQTYFYQAWGRVNVSLNIQIENPIDKVYEIGTCGFYVPERVDTLGVRPGCPPPPPDGFLLQAESNLCWFDLKRRRSFTQQYSAGYHLMPAYFALFEKGVEGIEFWREDCSKAWDMPFGLNPGQGIFLDDSKRLPPGLKYIRVEPFNSWTDPRTFRPTSETFNYTLGLPFVRKKDDAKKTIFHVAINSRNWPDREKMKKLAASGINLIRLHDDNTFLNPSWRDCYYPPYDEENMKKMDQVIGWAHEFGIKIVPYFSLKEFHPDCPEYPEFSHKWKRWVPSDGRILAEEGPYGGYMCMKSGWMEFLKSTIRRVLENHKFDGVYYDHLWFRYCRHPEHANGLWHDDADEILDFLFWTRQYLKKDGIIVLHTSACPTMIGENLSDMIFIGEDMPYARPLPDTFPPDMDFVPITARNWVPAGAHWSQELRESMLISCLKHCPGGLHVIHDFMLDMASIFKDFALNDLHFHGRTENAEKTVYTNFYCDDSRVLLFCANLVKSEQEVKLNIPLSAMIGKKKLCGISAKRNLEIIEHSPDFTQITVKCQAENAGVIEFKIQD